VGKGGKRHCEPLIRSEPPARRPAVAVAFRRPKRYNPVQRSFQQGDRGTGPGAHQGHSPGWLWCGTMAVWWPGRVVPAWQNLRRLAPGEVGKAALSRGRGQEATVGARHAYRCVGSCQSIETPASPWQTWQGCPVRSVSGYQSRACARNHLCHRPASGGKGGCRWPRWLSRAGQNSAARLAAPTSIGPLRRACESECPCSWEAFLP
jgi:hypothetical protein